MARRRAEINDCNEENIEESLEETTAANSDANNSIIGKMRSSVTSIFPNSLSKWFSPSSNNNNNDSANGSYVAIKRTRSEADANTPHARIERRSEIMRRRIEESGYTVDDDGDGVGGGEGEGGGDELEDDEAVEESNHSDDEINNVSTNVQRRRNLDLISPFDTDQPPSKRSRMTLDSTMLSSRRLVASTPAFNMQRNSGALNNHYGHLNMYAGANRKELGYNFYASSTTAPNFEQNDAAPDIIDLIPIPMPSVNNDILNERKVNQHIESEAARSRRCLNIPLTTTTPLLGSTVPSSVLPSLKRQSLKSVKSNVGNSNKSNCGTTVPKKRSVDIQSYYHKNDSEAPEPARELHEELLESQSYNGDDQQKFQNGANDFEDDLGHRSVTDSDAEDADTIGDLQTNPAIHSTLNAGMTSQRAVSSGLFNMSSGNSRSGSRTSSFGNGLNFYTHLEGRKSLFSGNHSGTRSNIGNPFNSSTLSLNSLSRRQFNASIYGSTSALSDSRLLNTSSPFYKGNTTYGGAAAYSKYATSLGSNSRLTPTLIRPTSSLSTLSSSSNSIAAGAGISTVHGEQNPAISGTAKTILDLLNGFTTPLSEAKKMANSLRQQPLSTTTPQSSKSKRLSDADLQASRTMRLQQVRTPYMRPAVMLQPKNSANESQMPPVRELQVPSMSQLLQMRKLQNLTERSRQITMQVSNNEEYSVPAFSSAMKSVAPDQLPTEIEQPKPTGYTLPTATTFEHHMELGSVFDTGSKSDSKQMKHVNKIKNHKIAYPARSVPDMPDESPPIPANLPNISFPIMTEMPKIDIALPTTSKKCVSQLTETESIKTNINTSLTETDSKHIADNFKFSPPVDLKVKPSSMLGIEPSSVEFEFSKPTPLEATSSCTTVRKAETKSEVRPSLSSGLFSLPKSNTTSVPTLKTGSVLDALEKMFVPSKSLSLSTTDTVTPTTSSQPLGSFGNQFQKAANEWECDTCMVRNKDIAQKCVACNVPRKGGAVSTSKQMHLDTSAAILPLTAGFGEQFKKQTGEWECDTCMVRNKPESDKCVSCETVRRAAKSILQTDAPKPFGKSIFGNPLNTTTPPSTVTIASDSGFKTLAAAQQASKWECVACMTRNESSRSKCVCCEQPKPGCESQKENAPSFNFGATAASKFNFGFSAGAPDPAKSKILCPKAAEPIVNTTISSEKPEDGKSVPPKGFTFGNETNAGNTHNNLSFGFQVKSTTTPDKSSIATCKDTSDSSTKATAFSFGLGNLASSKANTNLTCSATTTKHETLTITTAATSNATVTTPETSTIMASFTPPKVTSLSSANTPITTGPIVSTLATTKPQEGFGFGLAFQKPETNTVSSTSITLSSSPQKMKLTFPSATPKTTVASLAVTSSVSGTTNAVSPAFSFGVVSTSATSTTATAKPMFSFGAPLVPSTSAGNVSSSTTGIGSANNNNSSKSAGIVGFGFTNNTSSALAATSTAESKSSFAVNPNASTNVPSTLNSFTAFGSQKIDPQAASTITVTTASAFGSFNFAGATSTTSKIEGGNIFGTFTPKTQDESKPVASAAPIFGNASAQAEPIKTTSSTWSKNTFLFGSPTSNEAVKVPNPGNNEPASKAVFGSLKTQVTESTAASAKSNQNAMSSIFGSANVSSSALNFGNNNTASTIIFGTGSAPATANTTNLFGSNTNNTTAPQFGTMSSGQTTLGNNLTANNATPAFGSTAPVSFGSFGPAAVTASATSTTNSELSSQPAATPFVFGAPQTQTTSSGFNFGTTATSRPAFNFSSTNQPASFNFTGNSTETTQNSTRPFQFGATAAPNFNAPSVYNFGSAPSIEATSNTPFQFNAGSAPATSNIFAPTPTSSITTQAARRKVRIPTRRLPPR